MVLCLFGGTQAFPDTVLTKQRSITPVAEGVYLIRHPDAPNGIPNGNTTVVIGARDVLVVDSGYLASQARQDIEQIRRWTDKPVRYLVNTHWHNDHTMGNGTYSEVFPGLQVIAQQETRVMMAGYLKDWFARHQKEIARLKGEISTSKTEDGKPLTPTQLEETRHDLSGEEEVVREFPNFVPKLPDLVLDKELSLDLGSRPVEIKFLGRGNTAGDVVVFLPKERILITGDLVVHPVPYLCSGYPSEWAETLGRLIDLNPAAIIPGHGEPLHDLAYPRQVQDLLRSVVSEVRHTFYVLGNGKPLEDIRKVVEQKINFESVRREFDGGDPDNFDQSSAIQQCLVRNAYYEEVLR